MSQIRTRHHDGDARRPVGRRVAGSRAGARRTLEAGAAARTQEPTLDEPTDLAPGTAGADDRTAPVAVPAPDVRARRPHRGRFLGRKGGASGAERPFAGGWPLVVGLVLAAALVALVVTAGLLTRQLRHDDATAAAQDRALAAARTEAQAFLSYDYRHLDQDFAAAKAGLTGRFASEYAATSEQVVRPTATQYQAVVKADVISLGVVDAAPDQVVVLAYVDQTTTSTRLAGPRVDANRVRMTLVPVHGRWKVAAVDAL